jgi:hypothetical protein
LGVPAMRRAQCRRPCGRRGGAGSAECWKREETAVIVRVGSWLRASAASRACRGHSQGQNIVCGTQCIG